MKKFIYTSCLIILISSFFLCKTLAAEPNNNLTTITVDASDNESGNLMYAIDSDDPGAFSTSNEFVVEAGTSHTVYVKDEAGNISGQVITAPIEKVGIEVTIGQDGTDSALASASASRNAGKAVEAGGGTINEKTITDGSSSSEKIFYTITTPSENVFYMVIDNTRSSDNVYLLNQVTEEDLLALVEGGDAKESKKLPLFNNDSESDVEDEVAEETQKEDKAQQKDNNNIIIIIVGALIMGGIYYYLKIYKPKKANEMDMMDAMDIDEFELEEEFEEDDDMYEDDDMREEMLKKIMEDDPEEEAEEEAEEDTENEED